MALFNFGLASPSQVRQELGQRLFAGTQGLSGPAFAGRAIGLALGAGAGGLFSDSNPQIAKAQRIEQIKQGVVDQFGDTDDMASVQSAGKMLADQLAQAGFMEEAFQVAGQLSKIAPATSDRDLEFWKEERKAAAQTVKGLSARASTLRSDYGKLEQLSKRAKGKGTSARAARNSMIANIVRLNSPGIVSEQELKTYTGGQATTAAMLQYLQGKGVDTSSLMANIDPSGENFDVDGMLGLGRDLILGQAAPIFDQYADAEARASRAGISKRAYSTIFGKNKNLEALRTLATPQATPKQKIQVVDW